MHDAGPAPNVQSLIARLPKTFGPALNDQFRRWDLLFPAEQRQLRSQCAWLAAQPREAFRKLFAPLLEVETRMVLPRWGAASGGMSVQDAGQLARSPFYAQWRQSVANIFSQIDEGVSASGGLVRPPALLICALPAGLPMTGQPLWPELAKNGVWIKLDKPFGQILGPLTRQLAARDPAAGVEPLEATWILESESKFGSLSGETSASVLSWAALEPARREFLKALNSIRRDLASVDRMNEELTRVNLAPLVDPHLASKPVLQEFVRTLLLSGNGSLIFGNSFVQWGASEALRRAQPQVLIASFGVRQKLKPFSSTVLFEDQNRSNPVRDDEDPAGSLIDGLMLANYVCLSAQRLAQPNSKRLTLLAAADLDRVLAVGGPSSMEIESSGEKLARLTLAWLNSPL